MILRELLGRSQGESGEMISTLTGIIVWLTLLLFGLGYNWAVSYLERKHYEEGIISLLVAVGVAVTIGGVAILDVNAALLALAMFSASGLPMIAGSLWRYVQLREQAQKVKRDANAKQAVA